MRFIANDVRSDGVSAVFAFFSASSTPSASIRPYFSHRSTLRRGSGFWSAPQPAQNIACASGCAFSTYCCAKPA